MARPSGPGGVGTKGMEEPMENPPRLRPNNIYTFPDPTPTPIVFLDTAEHDGRYSEGSHTTFSKLYVIHAPSKLKPAP
jgi:hypothetical protein